VSRSLGAAMRRREFIGLAGGAVAWPVVARAQKENLVRHIAVVLPMAESDPAALPRIKALEAALEKLGWSVGRNIRIDYRWGAADADRFRAYAAELVGQAPEVILATGMPALSALRDRTLTTPIVFVLVVDPVSTGFVQSLAKPGGNITGFTNFEPPMIGKWLSLLKEFSPRLNSVLLIYDPDTTPVAGFLSLLKSSAAALTLQTSAIPVHGSAEISDAVNSFAVESKGGLVTLPCPTALVNRDLIISLAAQHRMPAIYPYNYFAKSGGLVSYGVGVVQVYQEAATYVDRILKGEKPGELPIQAPTKLELVINLKTAKALDLTVPPSLLAGADEVIE